MVGLAHAGALIMATLLSGCSRQETASDAFGNFEAREVLVSAETGGRLVAFSVREGQRLEAGTPVGLIDTLQVALRRDQIAAQARAVRSRFPGINAQIDILTTQRAVAERERDRMQALVAQGAGTQKQLDDILGQLDVLDRQIAAIRTQNAPVFAELDVLEAQRAVLDDQIQRSRISNPVAGTVLVSYAEQTEFTAPGKPLYRIAPLDTLELRAFVSGSQLGQVRMGEEVTVIVDGEGGTLDRMVGTVTWIASEAEFTPKLIQTREERVHLVYAFKVAVANPAGKLKAGMPGEVILDPGVR